MAQLFPIQLDLSRMKIVIVGGGTVAARKAAAALECGAADVTAIALSFIDPFPDVNRIQRAYAAGDLARARIVFAATDNAAVNEAVVIDARAVGAWVSRADAEAGLPGDFISPARLTAGDISMTVSAVSPALTATIRNELLARIDPRWTTMAALMQRWRPWIREESGLAVAQRHELFRALAEPMALDVLHDQGIDVLLAWLAARFPGIPLPPKM